MPAARAARPCWVTPRPRSASGRARSQLAASAEPLRRADQQQDVAGAHRQLPDALAEPLALARDAEQGDAGMAVEADRAGRAAVEPRIARHHHLEQGEVGTAALPRCCRGRESRASARRPARRSPRPGRRRPGRRPRDLARAGRRREAGGRCGPGRARRRRLRPPSSSRSPTFRPIGRRFRRDREFGDIAVDVAEIGGRRLLRRCRPGSAASR